VEVSLDQSNIASISALLGVKSIAESNNQAIADLIPQVESNSQAVTDLATQVDTKQDLLSAGTGFVFHEKLLEANTIKSLTAGANVTLVSTGEFVSISAEGGGATSAEGPAGTFSLVNEAGEIRRIRPGAGAYAMDQGASVEVGVQLQAAQFQAPFAVMDQANATALRARLGETRAEFFTAVEVNGALSVSGTDFDTALASKQAALEQPGVGSELLYDGNRLKRVSCGAGITGGTTGQPDGSQNLEFRVSDSLALAGDLTTTGTTRCDVFKGRQASEVTCQDNLTVTGVLECQDSVAVQGDVGLGQLRLRHDSTAVIVERFSGGAWERAATIGHDDTSGGAVVTDNLGVDGTAIVNNLEIGGSLSGWSPLFCAGHVNANATVASSVGRVGYTVSRPSGFATGVYRIDFATPAPTSDYVVTLTLFASGANLNIRIWNSTDAPGRIPTTTSFHAVTAGETGVTNLGFHFAVMF
jgi:hypothetical protein